MNRRSSRPVSGPLSLLKRFARHRGGAVAVWFAVLALPMAVLGFGLIDVNRAAVEKRHLQDALDAATLLAARSTAATNSQIQSVGAAALVAQLTGASDSTLKTSTFTVSGSTVTGTATATVTPVIANLWLGGDMTVGARSEVTRASTNLEVALVLDITGSMDGDALDDLKQASKDLIDYVVQDVQTPYYSKASVVPYSMGVNVGSYATAARGAVTGTKSITGIAWQSGSSKSISGISRGSTTTITSSSHGFNTGDVVYITGVNGTTQINNKYYTITRLSSSTFSLNNTNSNYWSNYSSGGTIRKCMVAACELVVTAASHGYTNGQEIYIDGVNGLTALNEELFNVGNITTNTFSLTGTLGPTSSSWTSGGKTYCTAYGCEYFRFTNANSRTPASRMFQASTCVAERTGTNAYTDVSPSTSKVSFNYPSSSNPCPSATLTPLTSNKSTLKTQITNFSAAGSTAGQIGVAWGWYTLSPNFAYMFPSGSQGAAYGTKDLLKVAVIMTDGDFNTSYCEGVIAKNSGSGSGSSQDHNNCPATNGDATDQAAALCTAMKTKGIVIYTVGFNIKKNSDAEKLLTGCANDAAHLYLPSSGGALKDAFSAIGRDIMKLRITK